MNGPFPMAMLNSQKVIPLLTLWQFDIAMQHDNESFSLLCDAPGHDS